MKKLINDSQTAAIKEAIDSYHVPKPLMAQALGVSIVTLNRSVKGLAAKKRQSLTESQVRQAHAMHTKYRVPIITLATLLGVSDTPLRKHIAKLGLELLDYREVKRDMDREPVTPEEYILAKKMHDFGLSWSKIARLTGRHSGSVYQRKITKGRF